MLHSVTPRHHVHFISFQSHYCTREHGDQPLEPGDYQYAEHWGCGIMSVYFARNRGVQDFFSPPLPLGRLAKFKLLAFIVSIMKSRHSKPRRASKTLAVREHALQINRARVASPLHTYAAPLYRLLVRMRYAARGGRCSKQAHQTAIFSWNQHCTNMVCCKPRPCLYLSSSRSGAATVQTF